MALSAELLDEFDYKVRQRGEAYFKRGDAEIIDTTPGRIVAKVRGSRLYTVTINFNDDELDVSCTCPYAADWGSACKHAWAAVRQAQKQGLIELDESLDEKPADEDEPRYRPMSFAQKLTKFTPTEVPDWKKTLQQLKKREQSHHLPPAAPFPDDRRIIYLIDVAQSAQSNDGLWLELFTQKHTKSNTWERPKHFQMDQRQWAAAPDESDRILYQMLNGSQQVGGYTQFYNGPNRRYLLPSTAYATALKMMCTSGRCGLRNEPKPQGFTPLHWDDAGPWEYWLELTPSPGGKHVIVNGSLRRGDERMEISEPTMITRDGLIIAHNRVALLNHFGAWPLLHSQRQHKELKATIDELNEFLQELGALPDLPRLEVAPEFQVEIVEPKPVPRLTISRPRKNPEADQELTAQLSFEYGEKIVDFRMPNNAMFDSTARRFVHRDRSFEQSAYSHLLALGLRRSWTYDAGGEALSLSSANLHRVVLTLSAQGWHVQAEGSIYHRAGQVRMQIKGSGIDWFELEGGIEFDGKLVTLPKLLAAMQSGQNMVQLDDGSIGLLPETWLRKYAPLAAMGAESGDALRFEKNQLGFLDALLMEMPELTCDATVQQARKEIREFDKIDAIEAPEGFVGTLRPYQKEGLGWLQFCQRFGFGGCLADDMGLGKTVQVLALLEQRRQAKSGPSLVVVPRSLVFNWKAEAQKFAPNLRLLDHSGIGRIRATEHFPDFDLIITTYGTLRRDAGYFKDITFDYVILDEAQAIKNNTTEAAKAARLLRGKHKLALTGTPIENHVGELWSLFEYLNPGMLGGISVFRSLVGQEQNAEGRQLLSRALRPFILRRTKGQVATDLPEKLEQTIFCELEAPQRKLYDELREHYRQTLMGSIAAVGLNKSKIQILEALLRLRQAACHPGLIDKKRSGEASAKLDALAEQLGEVLEEGHKALVFSQFTSFLSLLRTRLDADKTPYEYLDGKTRDREARVERFQTDPDCKLFLVSLKAGGVGLNLTAADYVFLLDPWWNPAVESQAIDRTHRIGQTRRVFAYRLIARDTVEEKVLQLQQSKRDLADAIITADNSLISKLGKEDLELLLS